jgi:hypothetical protein
MGFPETAGRAGNAGKKRRKGQKSIETAALDWLIALCAKAILAPYADAGGFGAARRSPKRRAKK